MRYYKIFYYQVNDLEAYLYNTVGSGEDLERMEREPYFDIVDYQSLGPDDPDRIMFEEVEKENAQKTV